MIEATESELREGLEAALSVPRWVEELEAQSPFESLDELLHAARAAATPLSPGEIDQAMAHHPRIGEKAAGTGAAAVHSRHEQAGLGHSSDEDDAELTAAIAAGNAAYEARFDRVFLIRAAGRTRAEILHELDRRLTLDNETELAIVGEQLREIALLRLAATFGSKEDSL
ncbi:MAG: 2-oxo-4-hydroxy-4-carboxy-5-ureidoimidazoline decarboxylase [Actinomycetota bacterium]|nr:2-oxo-4-hydroxy-4-carboxy-5-ureidoimidazoline decarboxylase [Actinomycetota bacterium]